MLDPGTFDRKVSFCVPVTTTTAMGAPSKTFTHSFYMMMNREQTGSGNEQPVNSRLVVPTMYRYKGHFSPSINETLQIVDASVKYNILSVNPLESNLFIELLVEKITE
jgi:hypothetical protein